MQLAIRVQHAVGRDAPLARLLEHLPPAVEVITDHEAAVTLNPWRGFMLCFNDIPADITHLAILQDDAWPCKNFSIEAEDRIRERPNNVLSFFTGGLPGRTRKNFLEALGRGDRWSEVWFREIHHTVATVWPIELATHFVDFVENNKIPGPNPPRSDDAVVGYWARKNRNLGPVWATVPCLVQHDDEFPSVVQGPNRFSDKGRRAIAFLDDMVVAT